MDIRAFKPDTTIEEFTLFFRNDIWPQVMIFSNISTFFYIIFEG